MLLFLYRQKIFCGILAAIFLIATKENYYFFFPFFLFPIWLEKDFKFTKQQKLALSFFFLISPVAWHFFIKYSVSPFFLGTDYSSNHVIARFPGFGTSSEEVVKNLLFNPFFWKKIMTERVLKIDFLNYFFLLFGPWIILIYKRWYWILAALPLIMMNALSYTSNQRALSFHYELAFFPLLIFPLLLTLNQRKISLRKKILILCFALSFSGRWPLFYVWKYFPNSTDIQNQFFFNSINTTQPVYATPKIIAQISHLKELRIYQGIPEIIKKENGLIVDFKIENDKKIYFLREP